MPAYEAPPVLPGGSFLTVLPFHTPVKLGRNRPLSGALKNQRFTNAVPMGYNEAGYWNPPRYNRSTGLPRKKRKITWIRKENGNA